MFGCDADSRIGLFRLQHRPRLQTICRDEPTRMEENDSAAAHTNPPPQVYLCDYPTRLTLDALYLETGFHLGCRGLQLALLWRERWKTPS